MTSDYQSPTSDDDTFAASPHPHELLLPKYPFKFPFQYAMHPTSKQAQTCERRRKASSDFPIIPSPPLLTMKRSPSIQPPEFSLPSSQTIPPRAKRELGYWEWFRSRGFPFDVPARRAYLEDYPDMIS